MPDKRLLISIQQGAWTLKIGGIYALKSGQHLRRSFRLCFAQKRLTVNAKETYDFGTVSKVSLLAQIV